jgi:hypothetical protein
MDKGKRIQVIRWILVTGILGSTAPAFAETETHDSDDGYGVRFEDELMLGDTLSLMDELQRIRPGFARVMLIRPRVDLRTQLLQSVEEL